MIYIQTSKVTWMVMIKSIFLKIIYLYLISFNYAICKLKKTKQEVIQNICKLKTKSRGNPNIPTNVYNRILFLIYYL